MPEHTVAILGFHKIGPPPAGGWDSWFYVSELAFERFLSQLHSSGWEVIDMNRFLDGLNDPAALPTRAALLTFDDGYRSMRRFALPVLQRFDAPAILFVPTDYIGGRNTFDCGVEPDEEICDIDDLRALSLAGVSIQSHAASHRRFSELTTKQRVDEVVRSKATIESLLDTSVEMIAFPYGDPGAISDGALLEKAGYRAACLYGGGLLRVPVENPYRLERFAMGPDTDLQAALRRVE